MSNNSEIDESINRIQKMVSYKINHTSKTEIKNSEGKIVDTWYSWPANVPESAINEDWPAKE